MGDELISRILEIVDESRTVLNDAGPLLRRAEGLLAVPMERFDDSWAAEMRSIMEQIRAFQPRYASIIRSVDALTPSILPSDIRSNAEFAAAFEEMGIEVKTIAACHAEMVEIKRSLVAYADRVLKHHGENGGT